MVSVIISAKHVIPQSPLERNIYKTIGSEHELFLINNSAGKASLASIYNLGVKKAKGDILVFMHDDLFFMNRDWGNILSKKFSEQPDVGIIGIIGTEYLFENNCSWTAAGNPFLKGRLVQHLQNGDFFMVLFSTEKGDFEIVCCSGVFMAVRREVFDSASFDESTFDDFFFHDFDLCMQAREKWRLIVTTDIIAKHRSMGTYGDKWQLYGSRFLEKYKSVLPASCTDLVPNPDNPKSIRVTDLKGKVSQETIV